MATQEDVRRIAMALPGSLERPDRFAFAVTNKGKEKEFAWVWLERPEPKKPRIANPGVLAVRVAGEDAKQFLISAVPNIFFTEPHYNGYPAVLVRLEAIEVEQLEGLLLDAWQIQAPKAPRAGARRSASGTNDRT